MLFRSENKSHKAIGELKKLTNPRAKVLRNGVKSEIPTYEIVVGDVLFAEDGNIVSADAEIIKANDFSLNESILTGESLPVFKDNSAGNNRIYSGTLVVSGSCMAKVIAVGHSTEFGKIGLSLSEIESEKTPLQKQIRSFVKSMVAFGSVAFLAVWIINYWLTKNILHSLLHGLTLAMSVLPEEIPVAFSTFMALGAYHLYKLKVIARTPQTVETLGAATVICVDKTGTITENKMEIAAVYEFNADQLYDYTAIEIQHSEVLEYAMWASETEPFDMMEKSIHLAYSKVIAKDLRPDHKQVHEYPLSGNPPMMTHVFKNESGHTIIACKGGVESVLNQCSLSETITTKINSIAMALAKKGNRVLAVAKAKQTELKLPLYQTDFEFDFIGLISFYDPPKKNIRQVLESFYTAGIDVKMITGDYTETALAISKLTGFKNVGSALTGVEVMQMPAALLSKAVKQTSVFARMFPEAKLKVIEALKSNNEVVAMTGDGVNDGPALKAAHIGIAMGLRGSELAKKASALILTDDNLSHMVEAIATGRRIYENLKKAIQYIISIHIPIILIVTLPLLLRWKFANFFSPVHVIFLELIMGPTCSIIFENEPAEANSMKKPPRQSTNTFFSIHELAQSIIQGLAITAVCLGLGYYYMMQHYSESEVRTIIYATLIFSNIFLTLVNRSFYYSVIETLKYKNNLLPLIIVVSLIVLLLSIFFAPVRTIFQFTSISLAQMISSLGMALMGVIWIELIKFLKRRK